ncbi:MAG TPA: hypothetical protein VK553_07475, partial [Candidatus Nitrosopolaris rasttigaisensis]|nr:hypothetical protein [Candidatus Nitrosopolaris rasttigaisensis]
MSEEKWQHGIHKLSNLRKTIWRKQDLMVRPYRILVVVIAVIALVLAPAMYVTGASTAKATPS